jgi:hypothetical protein
MGFNVPWAQAPSGLKAYECLPCGEVRLKQRSKPDLSMDLAHGEPWSAHFGGTDTWSEHKGGVGPDALPG